MADQAPEVADVCIIGAGPAGIAVARELIGSGLRVCLVESGGEAPCPATDALACGEVSGAPVHPPQDSTRRAFGGASQAWDIRTGDPRPHLRHMALDPMDFARHDWMPESGWPFGRDTLEPFYRRARRLCGLEPGGSAQMAAWRLPLDPARVETEFCTFSPAETFHRLGLVALREAEREGQLRLLLHASVLRLEAEGEAVRRVLFAQRDGTRGVIAARAVVLAAGGVQNARLLLLSALGGPATGRYYHDHPLIFAGRFLPADQAVFARAASYDIHPSEGATRMGYLALSPAARRTARAGAVATFLFPRPERRATHALEAIRDGLRTWRGEAAMPIGPVKVAKLFARRPGVALRGLFAAGRGEPVLAGFKEGGWSRTTPPGGLWQSFHLWQQVEQTPEPENRVALGMARDRFGDPLPVLHWRWSDADDARVARAQEVLRAAISTAGLGRVELARRDGRTELSHPAGAHHVMGTTRMHADPHRGVVDAECRVHGLCNLFVAGSSVFPTGGAANPTLTILALALRLADRLQRDVSQPATARPAASVRQEA